VVVLLLAGGVVGGVGGVGEVVVEGIGIGMRVVMAAETGMGIGEGGTAGRL
jgi:hypothetical protein